MVRCLRVGVVVGGVLAGMMPAAAPALDLVEGRALHEPLGAAVPALDALRPAAVRELPGLTLSFTPRDSFGVGPEPGGRSEPPTLRLSLVPGDREAARVDRVDLLGGGTPRHRAASALDSDAFEVGGAFELDGWSLAGSYLELADVDGTTRVLGGGVGYGRLGLRLAYGQSERTFDPGDREFWLFSTNLAARSWLSLEGDVGYTPSQQTEPSSAVGRIGLRLRF
jgi:hypothetical protein